MKVRALDLQVGDITYCKEMGEAEVMSTEMKDGQLWVRFDYGVKAHFASNKANYWTERNPEFEVVNRMDEATEQEVDRHRNVKTVLVDGEYREECGCGKLLRPGYHSDHYLREIEAIMRKREAKAWEAGRESVGLQFLQPRNADGTLPAIKNPYERKA